MNEDYNNAEHKEEEYDYSNMSQSPYTGDNSYSQFNMNDNKKGTSNGFGIASLICGIISILSCCCSWIIGLPCGIAAVVLGIIQLVKYQEKGLAIGGIVTGIIGSIIAIIMGICTIVMVNTGVYQEMIDEIFEEYRMMMEYSEYDEEDHDLLAKNSVDGVLYSYKVPFEGGN